VRRPCTFKQNDLVRALKAAATAGLHVTGYKIDPQTGKIEVVTGEPQSPEAVEASEWDRD
jgi:hypothetical protein